MISRRNFLSGAGALAFTPLVRQVVGHYERFEQPLLIKPNNPKRVFYMHKAGTRGYRIVTDALNFPRKLVRPEVLGRQNGELVYNKMSQRDHWKLIDEGVFSGDDLFQPAFMNNAFDAWSDHYTPEVEAHWLLQDYGLGPEACEEADIGLQFAEVDGEFSKPTVICSDDLAASLLQAELTTRGHSIEIRMEERPKDVEIPRKEYLMNAGNRQGV